MADYPDLVRRYATFAIRHRRWVAPFAWLALVAALTGGAAWWGGFDSAAIPWIGGVLAIWVAGFLSGLACIAKRRRVGWLGLLGWIVVPIFHFGSAGLTDAEGWAPTFFADLLAILLALMAAGAAMAAAGLAPRPGSLWEQVEGAHLDQRTHPASQRGLMTLQSGSLLAVLTVAAMVTLLAACGRGDTGAPTTGAVETTTTTQATSTTLATTTSRATTTSTQATTTSTSAAPAPPDLPPLLVADADGVRVVDGESEVTFLTGTHAEFALPDLMGGVIFIGPDTDSWHWGWDAAAGIGVLVPDEPGGGPSPIMRVSEPGAEPEVLVEPTGFLWLEQVTQLDGHPTLIYRAQVPEPIECSQGQDECAWYSITDHLFALDLVTQARVDLGAIGSFESSFIEIRFSQDLLVVTTQEYGSDDACGAVLPRGVLVPSDLPAWIGEGAALWRTCEFGPMMECPSGEPSLCGGSFATTIAPDGATVAYVQAIEAWNPDGARPAELVVIDAATGAVLRRVEIGPARVATSWVEWDGTHALAGRLDTTRLGHDDQSIRPVIVMPDGMVYELDQAARYALWTPGG